jgi:hypothetical protein
MVDFQASHIDYLVVMVCLMVASAGRMMKMKKNAQVPAKITDNLVDLGYPPISGSPLIRGSHGLYKSRYNEVVCHHSSIIFPYVCSLKPVQMMVKSHHNQPIGVTWACSVDSFCQPSYVHLAF